MNKRLMILFILVSAVFSLTACGTGIGGEAGNGAGGTNEHVVIDWVDFIKINDTQYTGLHSSVIADPSMIGEKIGEVEFKVADNVSNPQYQVKNGDAAFQDKGTEIFAVKNLPDFAAIKDSNEVNGYQLYQADKSETDISRSFKDVDKGKISKVEFYQEKSPGEPELLNQLTSQKDIQTLISLLDKGERRTDFAPNHSEGPVDRHQMVLYIDQPLVNTYSINYDHETWYWHPRDTEILPDKISEYITN
ncbi:hypothetical protein GCM10008986_10240 [Salinibacillus aidingensis]|uniref:Lipoprotein n=1 Tax=Salinibacillus aidingensis TaxID=237684 RepID=A0ABN1AZM2_9BACI